MLFFVITFYVCVYTPAINHFYVPIPGTICFWGLFSIIKLHKVRELVFTGVSETS